MPALLFPTLLAAVVVALGFAAWSVVHEFRERRVALAALGSPELLDRTGALAEDRRRRRRAALRLGALFAAGLALARPQLGTIDRTASRSGRDVLVALDLSRSMLVRDADGTRLDQAKRLAKQLIAGAPGDRVGLIVFGGAAFLQLPLNADHAAFERFLDAATPDDIDDPATDVAAPLHLAAATFAHEGASGPRAIMLLSDGERSEGGLDAPIAKLRAAGIPVLAVGVGTETGGFVPADPTSPADSGSQWHRDNIGRAVVSRLAAADLRRITDGTLGAYASWNNRPALATLAARYRALPTKTTGDATTHERAERFQWPLAVAVLLLGVELFGVGLRRRRLAPAAVATATLLGACVGRGADLRRANAFFDAGKFPEALRLYDRTLAKHPDPAVRFNAGNAQYRLSRYLDAIKHYREATAAPPPLRDAVFFNLGNAYVRAAEAAPEAERRELFERGIAAYEEVLRAHPDDRDAKWNLEVAVRKRGDIETGGSPGRGGRAGAGRGDGREEGLDPERETAVGAMAGGGQGDAQGESAEELDAEQARRLLEAIERQQLKSHEGRPAREGGHGERDW